MNTPTHDLKEIIDAVRKLPPQEIEVFRQWFAEFDAANWDRQIEQDVAAGRLDRHVDG